MPTYVITRTHRGPRRRRYVAVNRIENRLPGRIAFLMNLARLRAMQLAQRSEENGEAEHSNGDDHTDDSSDSPLPHDRTDGTDGTDHSSSEDSGTGSPESSQDGTPKDRREPADESASSQVSPYDEWTKGELYDRARELDIPGRSKMNKAELVAELRERKD
ncbi:MAG: Rho termination factor N-terminal domain-containing protein [Ilumatobacter sp.]|uniref:Rho termination factor N-terminal domain-containing protein n=1 Tax=Ilumatobacter sp. TaxID=1967498 RepID=UPI003C720395